MRSGFEWDDSQAEQLSDDSKWLPPRRVIHPSEKPVWRKRFYQLLVLLFTLLLVVLFIWGTHTT